MNLTIASTHQENWNYVAAGGVATLEIYVSGGDFFTFDGLKMSEHEVNQRAGQPGSYRSVACTVNTSTKVLSIPQISNLPTTDDALDNQRSHYTAALYDSNGKLAEIFLEAFTVPTSLAPSTAWAELRRHQAAVRPVRSPDTWNIEQIRAYVLSFFISSNETSVRSYASLPVAISTIGSINATLLIDSAVTVPSSLTIPANVVLRFIGTGQINTASGQVLTILGGLEAPRRQIFSGSGTVRFTGAYPEAFYPEWWGTDDLASWNAMLASMMKDDGGGLPLGGRVVLQGGRVYTPSGTWHMRRDIHLTSSGGRGNAIVRWPENTVGLVAHGLSTFNGTGSASNGRAENGVIENLTLSGTDGETTNSTVTLNRWVVTRIAGTPFDQTASIQDGCTIFINGRDWLIQSVDSASQITLQNRQPIRLLADGTNVLTNIGFQITSPDMIGMNISYAGEKRTISAVTPVGAGGTDYGYAALLTLTGAPVPSISLTAAGSGYTSTPTVTISGGGGTGATATATVDLVSGTVTGVTLTDEGYGYTSAPTVSITGGGGTGATASLGALPGANVSAGSGTGFLTGGFKSTLGSKAARQNIYHGLDLRTTMTVRNVQITTFHGNGLNSNSTQSPSRSLSVEPNSNISTLERVWSDFNSGSGFYLYGVNSNASVLIGLSAHNNHGFGIYDHSFLGNTYIAPHLLSNHLGGYFTTQGGNNVTTLINPYAEGDEPANRFGGLTNIIGANLANDNDEATEASKKLGVGATVDTWLAHGGVSRGNVGEPPVMLTVANNQETVSTAYTFYLADTSGGAINYNLPIPAPTNIGRRFYFKRRAGGNSFTIFATGGATVDGGGSVSGNSGVWILYAATNVWITL